MPAENASRIEISQASRHWTRVPRVAALCRKAAALALDMGRAALPSRHPLKRAKNVEFSIVLSSDAAIRRLNAQWRGQDKATNVLSFPAADASPAAPGVPTLLGDVVVAYGTTAREARMEKKTLNHHLGHLVVHGVLHLLGYDHEHDRDARIMQRLEIKILARLGIPDPYGAGERPQR